MKEIWFAIGVCSDPAKGVCNDPAIGKESMHIKFFNSRLEAYDQMDTYICLFQSAYMGKVPKENLK